MTRNEIILLARAMVRTLRNGVMRAAHYLRSVGMELESALRAIFGDLA